MRVFISFHRADIAQKQKLERILLEKNINYYSVRDDAIFDGQSHQSIATYFANKVRSCDILLCLIGRETYARPHVDFEIHTALTGGINQRKGIIAVMIENRDDWKNNIDFDTFPTKLADNLDYVVIEQFSSLHNRILKSIEKADNNRKNPHLHVTHKNPVMPLRNGNYYDS